MLNICEMAKDTAIVTMEGEYGIIPKLSNGTIFSDLSYLDLDFKVMGN